MKIKTKIILALVSVGIFSVLTASSIIGWTSTDFGKKALEKSAMDQLISIREIKKTQIEDYFRFIQDQVKTFSNDRMIINAIQEFNSSFHSYPSELEVLNYGRFYDELSTYYSDEFLKQYQNVNNNSKLDIKQVMAQLDNEAIALQYRYIQANPHALGSKDELIDTGGDSNYELAHKKYHPHIRDYLKKFGYYDIFLVDSNTGDIVYSVFKELDYATSLIDGPYADSGIAEAFKAANTMTEQDSFVLTDFEPYTPSYESPAAFIASPIFENGVKVGVLIFQMPISKIDEIMTYNHQWAESGLGESGETYLVGADLTMRSQGRFMIEDKAAYTSLLKTLGYKESLINSISEKETTIGLQLVDTKGVRDALKGKSGFDIFPDYRGIPVLSAYSPLNVEGMNWVIMSEIDEAEAFAPVKSLINQVLSFSLITALVIIGAATGLGIFLGKILSKPINSMINSVVACVQDITSGDGDLTFRLDESSRDEMSGLAKAVNSFIETIQAIIREMKAASSQVAIAATEMTQVIEKTNKGVERQFTETEQLATAMNEMTATAQDVASNASGAAVEANEADEKAQIGLRVVGVTVDSINSLAEEVERTSVVVNSLENDSQSIGSVLDVIRDIAEQTNLLALNAAIEAARAGEQGRGFAVVADEVRTLASRTQSSTQEIQDMIENLQNSARQASSVMRDSCEHANKSVTHASEAGGALQTISEVISRIDSRNTQIATAAEEQTAVAEEINRSVISISDIGRETAVGSEQISSSSMNLAKLASSLQEQVEQFKV